MCSEEETGRPCLEKAMDKSEAEVVGTSGAMEVDGGASREDVMSEDEGDDYDYDYNQWDDYIRDGCGYKDDDDDFEEGPSTGKHGGQFGGNGIRRSGGIRGRGVGTGKRGSGR
ncbi:hypothetical protein Bca52824_025737 [Brassica carinata]|uniref:Uncharacterized protein n=1 Tax=Brassica carinata TaxID=52824 RepID=A0A8X7SF79_BRACI|nr:hypothetical protein Bca52824_025737 [Brassica carinata]